MKMLPATPDEIILKSRNLVIDEFDVVDYEAVILSPMPCKVVFSRPSPVPLLL